MFITIEGPDGGGKTTQIPLLAEFLRGKGKNVITTREPGSTSIGDQIRQVLMRLDNRSLLPRTEILLFLAARAQLVEEVIRPNLEQGCIVISDRYADSTLAYQGFGHGVDLKTLHLLLDFATNNLKPDLTILLDIPAEEGLSRRRSTGVEWNRMDAYQLEFHRRVRAGYLVLAQDEPQRWVVVDARQPVDALQTALRAIISAHISG